MESGEVAIFYAAQNSELQLAVVRIYSKPGAPFDRLHGQTA